MLAAIIWFLVFILLLGTLAYRRVSLTASTISVGVYLLIYTVFGDGGVIWDSICWALFAAIAIPLNVRSLRRQWLTKPVLGIYQKITPEMSDTEQAALEAGAVWWDGDLFTGKPDWNKLLAVPKPRVSEREQAFLDNEVETLCAMLDDWHITHELADLPENVWQYIKDKGFFAMIIPRKFGGLEFSALAQSEVLIKVASRSPTAASIIAVPNSLGPGELLLRYGTEQQQNYYLPRLASGEDVPCFALTSPEAGSDAGSIPDTGVVCKQQVDGKSVLGLKLTFDKRYITLAPVATVIGLAFKLHDPDHLLGDPDKTDYGITCALIPRDTKGLTIGRRHFPLNIPFQNGPLSGKDIFVPLDTIIGGVDMAGQGWRMLVECLTAGRSISLPSNTTGASKLGVFATGAYARIRKQFNLPVARFEGVEEAMARMGGKLYAMDAMRTMSVGAIDQGIIPAVPSSICKYHATEMGRDVANDAMDIHGGKGIQLGPKNYLGRGYQSVPIAITVEGANILTRSLMIFGQGAIRCHPFVLKEMKAAQLDNRKKALVEFDKVLWGHIGFAISNAVRAFVLAATHARYTSVPAKDATRRYFQHLDRYSAAFALVSDAAMLTLGGKLKIKEKLSARLGDMLSYLYIASSVLKRFHDQGRKPEDLPLVHWAARDMIYRLQEQLHGLLRNFPNRFVAGVLRILVFPTGRRYSAPSDQCGKDVVELMITPGAARDRLTHGTYISDPKSHIGMMNEALELAVACEDAEKRIRDAQKDGSLKDDDRLDTISLALKAGVISADEAKSLTRLAELTLEIISVDDFAFDELGTESIKNPLEKSNGSAKKKTTTKKAGSKKKAASKKSTSKKTVNKSV
ncbi:MAG TPA: acyl-CoA dehydrogenase [Gammaproteobacteria bacterium]|nr:acyl-CoA dehydrogenase [Gammaproteobacteria bacterium]